MTDEQLAIMMENAFQWALSNALIRAADDMFRVMGMQSSSYAGGNFDAFAAYNSALADKSPLSEEELGKLEELSKKVGASAAEIVIRGALMGRLSTDGVKFDGTNELQILQKILDAGKKGLKGDPRKAFLDAYNRGVAAAIGGLQKIDDARYAQYKAARDGGAPHDEAWTFLNGGANAQRRYELERLAGLAQ